MANLITRYNDGTFEGIKSTWDSQINESSFASVTRSDDFAYEGVYSCKLELAPLTLGQNWGELTNISDFHIAEGDPVEQTLRVRCTADIPDDYYFILIGLPDLTKRRVIKVVQAVQCKTMWAEVRVNNHALTYPVPGDPDPVSYFQFYIVKDYAGFLDLGLAEYYPDLAYGSNSNAPWPVGAFVYIDAVSVEEKAVPIEVDEQLAGRKLYHVKNFFWLSDGVNLYDIAEPVGWDKIALSIEFDLSSYRYKFEFTDKDVVLKFDRACGYDVLRNLWNTIGPDAVASLKFGEMDADGNAEVLWEGSLMFSENYTDNKYTVDMTAEKRSLNETFRTRYDVDVNLLPKVTTSDVGQIEIVADTLVTLDGRKTAILPLSKIWMVPTVVNNQAQFEANPNAVNVGLDDNVFTERNPLYYQAIPLFKAKANSVENLNDPSEPDGTLFYSGLSFKDGVIEKRASISAKTSFTYTCTGVGLQAGMRIYKQSNISVFSDTPPPLPPVGPGVRYESVFDIGFSPPGPFTINPEIVLADFVLQPDEAVFIHCFIRGQESDPEFTLVSSEWSNLDTWYMGVITSETQQAAVVNSIKIHEALTKHIEMITDKPNALKSDFFGRTDLGYAQNGCGAKNVILNGLMIRGFLNKEFILSAKDWFSSLSVIYCLGMAIEKSVDGLTEWLRLEPLQFFFKNTQTLRLSIIYDYKRESADEFLFNELEFGDNKIANSNQNNSLQEWRGKKQYLSPFKTLKRKLSKVTDFVLSHIMISLTRAENSVNNPTGNYETDKNTFMIGYNDEITHFVSDDNVQFISSGRKIIFSNWKIPLVVGDVLTIAGTVSNNGVVTVVNVISNVQSNTVTIQVKGIVTNEMVASTDITFSSPRIVPETDEDFAQVSGIQSVGNKYPYFNLRHQVKRIALRWSKFFTVGYSFDTAQVVRFTSGVNNNNLQTKLKPGASCLGMDGESNVYGVKDSDDTVTTQDFGLSRPLFGKNYIYLSAPMSWTAFNRFRKAFEGRHIDGKNYGFLSWINPDGDGENGYCLSCKFDPVRQIAKFKTIEKAA